MQLSLTREGLLAPGRLATWQRTKQDELRRAVVRAFDKTGRTIAARIQKNVQARLKIRRAGFAKSYSYKVYSTKPGRLPAVALGSRVRFTGILEAGGSVRPQGKLLLIPFGQLRVGPKAFAALVRNLIARGDGYFKQVHGRLILFAENNSENDRDLRRFKRAERASRGLKKLKRGADVPIAVGVPQATISKRTDVFGIVKRALPEFAASIETEIRNGR